MNEFNDWEIMEKNTFNIKVNETENNTKIEKKLDQKELKEEKVDPVTIKENTSISTSDSSLKEKIEIKENSSNEIKDVNLVNEEKTENSSNIILDINDVILKCKKKSENKFYLFCKKLWKCISSCCKNTKD